MNNNDKKQFAGLMVGLSEVYDKEITQPLMQLYFESLKDYSIKEVSAAFTRHIKTPDSGRFFPKPADVIQMLEGSADDKALLAWSKVREAIERHGAYESIVFDDKIIHKVIFELGGWLYLCECKESDISFKANEFMKRYRAYTVKGLSGHIPSKLIGLTEAQNSKDGFDDFVAEPVLIGGEEKKLLT